MTATSGGTIPRAILWVAAAILVVSGCNGGGEGGGDDTDVDVDADTVSFETGVPDARDGGPMDTRDGSGQSDTGDRDARDDGGDVAEDASPTDTALDVDAGDDTDAGIDTVGDGGPETGGGETDGSSAGRFRVVDCGSTQPDELIQVGPTYSFSPQQVTVDTGDVVRWTWAPTVTLRHNVTADDDTSCSKAKPSWFQSQSTAARGNTFCVEFNATGTWHFQCTVKNHCSLGMKGTVEVK